MKTTTADALLGILSLGAMSGYELRQTIAGSIGNFWSESFGQIYPTLKRLESDGLIRGAEGDRAGSTVYSLTDAGRERLLEWLAVMPRAQVNRDESLLKLFFGNLAAPENVQEHITERRRLAAESLARFERMEPEMRREHAGHAGLPFWLMTLRYGIAEAQMTLAWCDETLAELARFAPGAEAPMLAGMAEGQA